MVGASGDQRWAAVVTAIDALMTDRDPGQAALTGVSVHLW
jgi:hypothetical protein